MNGLTSAGGSAGGLRVVAISEESSSSATHITLPEPASFALVEISYLAQTSIIAIRDGASYPNISSDGLTLNITEGDSPMAGLLKYIAFA